MKRVFGLFLIMIVLSGCGSGKNKELHKIDDSKNNTEIEKPERKPPCNSKLDTIVGEYSQSAFENDKDVRYIYDSHCNIVFAYGKEEYQILELATNGYLIMQKKNDTYNSSEITMGVYDLKNKKNVVEPTKEYYNSRSYTNYGDDMYQLDNDKKVFFNTRLAQVITFDIPVKEKFQDGYSVSMDNGQLVVYKDDGLIKYIPYDYSKYAYTFDGLIQNGYLCDIYLDLLDRGSFRIINLETGEIKELSDKFYKLQNKPRFTSDGYALVVFLNPGDVLYYTVIDTTGKMRFEPVKLNKELRYSTNYDMELHPNGLANIYDDKYFILTNDSETKSSIRDLDNKLILDSEDNERFINISNGKILVEHYLNGGFNSEYYYKDLEGNKLDEEVNN